MSHQSAAVIDLDTYRRARIPESNTKREAKEDPLHLTAELAWHLLQAIQVVKKLPH
jgi:hypothetical protein